MHELRILGLGLGLGVGLLFGLMPSCSVVNAPGSETVAGGAGGHSTTTSAGGHGGAGGHDCGPLNTLENCGACGVPCAPQNANGASCITGTCQYTACVGNYHDCDGNKSNGCESDPQTDNDNCGTCGHSCATLGFQNVTGTNCNGATCNYDACLPLYDDCDPGVPGCETAVTTLQDCGACGTPCAPSNAGGATCATGTCSYAQCTGSYQDCDGNAANGCESDKLSDANHCGNCNTQCSGQTPNCVNGQCGAACGSDCWGPTGCLTPGGHCIAFTCRDASSPPVLCSQCMGAEWQDVTVNDWLNGGYCADVTAQYRLIEGLTTQCGGPPACCVTAAACAGGDNAWHFTDGSQNWILGPTLGDYGGNSTTNCTFWNQVVSGTYTRLTACRKF